MICFLLLTSCAFFEQEDEIIDLSRVLKLDLYSAAIGRSYGRSVVKIGDQSYQIDSRQRGASSFRYPKKNYTLRFCEKNFASLKRSYPNAFGKLYNGEKLVLASNFDDTSYLRNRLAFKLWQWFDPKNHLTIETFFVELFLEGKFHGLYTAIDHVNESLLAAQGQRPSKGTLFKITGHQDDLDDVISSMEVKFSASKNPTGAFTAAIKFVDLFTRSQKEIFYDRFEKVARREDFEDWWVFVSLIHASDSAWKNAYLYGERGGKWRYLPWDFNASFGQFINSVFGESSNIISSRPKNLSRLLENHNRLFKLFLDKSTIRDRLYLSARKLIKKEWRLAKIETLIDRWVGDIEDLAKKDEKKWKEARKKVFGGSESANQRRNFENEIKSIKSWIRDKWQSSQTQLR